VDGFPLAETSRGNGGWWTIVSQFGAMMDDLDERCFGPGFCTIEATVGQGTTWVNEVNVLRINPLPLD
jgi:hypothetical protein